MINELDIQNFKSIKHLKLNCKRINVFIGEPNTGKSNILEAIGLLSHACYGRIEGFIRLENMIDLFHDHILDAPIEIVFDNTTLRLEFKDGSFNGFLNFVTEKGATSRIEKFFDYGYGGGAVGPGFRVLYEKFLSIFKFYRFTKIANFPNLKSDFLNPPHGDNLLHVVMTHEELRRIIQEMFRRFGYRIVLKPQEGKIEIWKGIEDIMIAFPYSLASETLQRMVFYLTAICSNKESIITFEEPEAHAFPYYTKYLAERIALDTNNNQYFISTHNPYFLISILEKTPKNEVTTFLTYLKNYQTEVKALTDKNKQRILGMGADVFFNIEKFLDHGN